MRYALVVACVVLVLVFASGFDPLLGPAVASGLLLGLLVRALWSNRHRVARFLKHPATLVAAFLLAAVVSVLIDRSQDYLPAIRVPRVVTPKYDGTVTWLDDKWQQTDRITLSPKLLAQIVDATSRTSSRDSIDFRLRNLLERSQWSIQKEGNGLLLTPHRRQHRPGYLDKVAELLTTHVMDYGWWVTRASDRLFASPRAVDSRTRLTEVTDELVRELTDERWEAKKVGDDLVFTRSEVTYDAIPRFPIKSTHRLEVDLPYVVFQSGEHVWLAPDGASRLVLSAPDNFIVATSPAESRQLGVENEIITFSLNSNIYDRATVDVEVLSPLFRHGPGKALATFSFTGLVRWLALIVAAVFSEEIKRLLLIPIRGVQRRLNLPPPEDTSQGE